MRWEWTIPTGFVAFFVVLALALFAIGDGSRPGDHHSEVTGASYLLQRGDSHTTLTSLDPVAVTEAEHGGSS